MNDALGEFIGVVCECVELCESIRQRLDDHLGVPPDRVNFSSVADAARVRDLLREAAFAAGVGDGPSP